MLGKNGTFSSFPVLRSLSALASVLVLTFQVSAATAETATQQQFGNWNLRCNEQNACTLYQGLHNPEKPNIIYSAQLVRNPDQSQPMLRFNLPLGVYLPPGVGVKVGSLETTIPVTVCLQSGCVVMTELDDKLEKALNDTDTLKLRVFTAQSSANELKFPLSGFADGLAELRSR